MGPAAWRARREVGLTIPVVAGLRPVRHLVYLCAIIPRPGAASGMLGGPASPAPALAGEPY